MKGIDEFSNKESIFDDFTKGTTLQFTLNFFENDGVTPLDVTDWEVWLAFSKKKDCNAPELEIQIPLINALGGIFSGDITDTETFTLDGDKKYYASAKYIRNDGASFVFDKAKLKVYNCVNPRIA